MKFLLLCASMCTFSSFSFKIDRVILGCDANPLYLEFWPVVAKTWKEIVGVKPTLALIATQDVYVDESLGDVIRFEPIPNIPTSFQAQVIRLLLPVLFENDICIISDMDMIPCQKDYFVNSVKDVGAECFVVYKDGAIDCNVYNEYPMCYNAALGKTFKEIFKIESSNQITQVMKDWYQLNLGWTSDQQILYNTLNQWDQRSTRLVKLGHDVHPRIDRAYWSYNEQALKNYYYTDSHMLRPYCQYSKHIDQLVAILLEQVR